MGLLEGLCGRLKLRVKEKREKLNQNQKKIQERRNVASWILKAPKRRKIQLTGVKMTEGIPFEEDYHDSMDGESYKCYFEKSICQNIPKHSVIVIDNAPYHSNNTENYPTSKWRKQQFVDWLTEKNITFPDKALRAELSTLVKSEREKFPDKVMETVAKEYGHEIASSPLPL